MPALFVFAFDFVCPEKLKCANYTNNKGLKVAIVNK